MSLKLRLMIKSVVFLIVSACSPGSNTEVVGSSALSQPGGTIRVCLLRSGSGVYCRAYKEKAVETSIPLGWVRSKSFGYEVVGEETVQQTALVMVADHLRGKTKYAKRRDCTLRNAVDWFADDGL